MFSGMVSTGRVKQSHHPLLHGRLNRLEATSPTTSSVHWLRKGMQHQQRPSQSCHPFCRRSSSFSKRRESFGIGPALLCLLPSRVQGEAVRRYNKSKRCA